MTYIKSPFNQPSYTSPLSIKSPLKLDLVQKIIINNRNSSYHFRSFICLTILFCFLVRKGFVCLGVGIRDPHKRESKIDESQSVSSVDFSIFLCNGFFQV